MVPVLDRVYLAPVDADAAGRAAVPVDHGDVVRPGRSVPAYPGEAAQGQAAALAAVADVYVARRRVRGHVDEAGLFRLLQYPVRFLFGNGAAGLHPVEHMLNRGKGKAYFYRPVAAVSRERFFLLADALVDHPGFRAFDKLRDAFIRLDRGIGRNLDADGHHL